MVNAAHLCESPRHQGPRYIAYPSDRYQLRIEYRRADGVSRPHVRAVENVCRTCMGADWRALEATPAPLVAKVLGTVRQMYETSPVPELDLMEVD